MLLTWWFACFAVGYFGCCLAWFGFLGLLFLVICFVWFGWFAGLLVVFWVFVYGFGVRWCSAGNCVFFDL